MDPAGPTTEVCGNHALVAADGLRRAVGDDAAELEHDNTVADAQYKAHVVVDQEHGLALICEPAQAAAELLALTRVESGAWFVEADDSVPAHPARERAGDADELARAL